MNATPNKHNSPWFLASVVLLAAIVAAVIFWQLNRSKPQTQQAEPEVATAVDQQLQEPATPTQEADTVDVARPPAVAQSTAEVAEAIEEPDMPGSSAGAVTLNASDAEVEAFLAQSGAASLNEWLTPKHKIRKLVRAINALEEGKLVSQHRPTLPPGSAFTAERDGNHWRLSEANFARYEPYIVALEQAGPERLAVLYRQYSPLLEQAYQELGVVDKGSFEDVTRRALQQVINAPDVDDQVALSSTSVVYRYQDKNLEKLPELHKLMIRMGPENRDRVQALAQQLLQQLEQ